MSRSPLPLFTLICFFIGILNAASPWMTFGGVVWLLLSGLEGESPSDNAGDRNLQALLFGGLSLCLGLAVMGVSAISGMLLAVWMNLWSSNTPRTDTPRLRESSDNSDS